MLFINHLNIIFALYAAMLKTAYIYLVKQNNKAPLILYHTFQEIYLSLNIPQYVIKCYIFVTAISPFLNLYYFAS